MGMMTEAEQGLGRTNFVWQAVMAVLDKCYGSRQAWIQYGCSGIEAAEKAIRTLHERAENNAARANEHFCAAEKLAQWVKPNAPKHIKELAQGFIGDDERDDR